MTIWNPELNARSGPRYLALAHAIEQDVATGALAAGTRLPPQRDLAYRLGVTVGTVSRAYALAAARGLVSGEVGRGTFVRGPEAGARANPVDDRAPDLIKLTVNAPPDPSEEAILREGLAELAARPAALRDLMSYTPKPGLADHRAAAAAWIGALGIAARADDVILTGGAHQALLAALVGLTARGDGVLVEQLTYAGICHIGERCGLRLRGLALDEEGVLPEALDAACRAEPARLLVLNPIIHNPTTATMSAERGRAIAALARAHDLIVIEDDVYGRLPEQRAAPIAALAPERTVYITSASKSIAPGLRLGMLLSPQRCFEAIAAAQHDLFLTCPPLMAELFKLWLCNGTAARLAQRQQVEARARQDLARDILGNRSYRAQPIAYHLWLPLPPPWRTSQFVAAARERGVVIDPGSA
jgi:DNA-binding transcriptional MocR family regulator